MTALAFAQELALFMAVCVVVLVLAWVGQMIKERMNGRD